MASRVTQVPRRTLIEPSDPVARVTQVTRRVLEEPSDPVARATQVTRRVLVFDAVIPGQSSSVILVGFD